MVVDNQENEFDEVAHEKLLKDLKKIDGEESKIGKSKVVRFSSEGSSANQLSNVLDKIGQKTLNKRTIKGRKTLETPLEKPISRRIRRAAGYESAVIDVNKWEGIVKKNRSSDQLSFPLENPDVRVVTSLQNIKPSFKTKMEKDVYSLLSGANLMEKKEETEEEKQKQRAMSLHEIRTKSRQMWGERQLKQRLERKAAKLNKSKSRNYHRILKRDRLRQLKRDFEQMKHTDPEKALEILQDIEKSRVEERMSLRHRKSKWLQAQNIKAGRDKKFRDVLQDNVEVRSDLLEKVKMPENESQGLDEESGDDIKQIMQEQREAVSLGKFDSQNAWVSQLAMPEEQQQEIDTGFLKMKNYWEDIHARKVTEKEAMEVVEKFEAKQNEKLHEANDVDAVKSDVVYDDITKEIKSTEKGKQRIVKKTKKFTKTSKVSEESTMSISEERDEHLKSVTGNNTKASPSKKKKNGQLKEKTLKSAKENGQLKENTLKSVKKNGQLKENTLKSATKNEQLKEKTFKSAKKNGQLKSADKNGKLKEKCSDPKLTNAKSTSLKQAKNKKKLSTKSELKVKKNTLLGKTKNKKSNNATSTNNLDAKYDNSKNTKPERTKNRAKSETLIESTTLSPKQGNKKTPKQGSNKKNDPKIIQEQLIDDLKIDSMFDQAAQTIKDKVMNTVTNSQLNSTKKFTKKCKLNPEKRLSTVDMEFTFEGKNTEEMNESTIRLQSIEDVENYSKAQEGSKSDLDTIKSSKANIDKWISKYSTARASNSKDITTMASNSKEETARTSNPKDNTVRTSNPKDNTTRTSNLKDNTTRASSSKDNTTRASSSKDNTTRASSSKDNTTRASSSKDKTAKVSNSKGITTMASNSKDETARASNSKDNTVRTSNLKDNTTKDSNSKDNTVRASSDVNKIESRRLGNTRSDLDILKRFRESDEDDPSSLDDLDDDLKDLFDDDENVKSFRAEKNSQEEKQKLEDFSLFKRGWGSWSGPGIVPSKKRMKRYRIKAPVAPPNKYSSVGNVIYDESADVHENIRKAMVSEIPHPFLSVADFEASIRQSLGRAFVPEAQHRKLTAAPIVTKIGAIIAPMGEEALLRNHEESKKRTNIEEKMNKALYEKNTKKNRSFPRKNIKNTLPNSSNSSAGSSAVIRRRARAKRKALGKPERSLKSFVIHK